MPMSETLADSILNTNLTTGNRYLWLHTDDPGADGSADPAQSTAGSTEAIHRERVTFGSPTNDTGFASEQGRKVLMSLANVAWTSEEIDPGQVVKYFSLWTSSGTGGTVIFMSSMTSQEVSNDGVTVAQNAIEVAIEIFKKSA